MKPLLSMLFLGIFFTSCRKKTDDQTSAIPPKDSTHVYVSPYPYWVSYAGRMHNSNNTYSYYSSTSFDTTYTAALTVNYPDSSCIKFHLAFWDIKHPTFMGGHDSLYYFEQDNEYVLNQVNAYMDSTHHHTLRYNLRNDSLLVYKFDGGANAQSVTFSGRKQ